MKLYLWPIVVYRPSLEKYGCRAYFALRLCFVENSFLKYNKLLNTTRHYLRYFVESDIKCIDVQRLEWTYNWYFEKVLKKDLPKSSSRTFNQRNTLKKEQNKSYPRQFQRSNTSKMSCLSEIVICTRRNIWDFYNFYQY